MSVVVTLRILAGLLWVGSLALPVYLATDGAGGYAGLGVLATGWLGPLAGSFAWYANLLLPLAISLRHRRVGVVASGVALGLALSALHRPLVCWDDRCHPAQAKMGAFVWIGAVACVFAANLTAALQATPNRRRGRSGAA